MALFSDDSNFLSDIFGSKQGFFSSSQDTTARDITACVVAGVAVAFLLVYSPAILIIGLILAAAIAIALNPEKVSDCFNSFTK